MKLTMKTLMLIMMGSAALVILYLVFYNHPIQEWRDLPVVVKILCAPPMAGLAYMVLYLPGKWVVGLVKGRRGNDKK